MKNQVVIAVVTVLIIALGVQTYMIYQLNDKVNHLTRQATPTTAQINKRPSTSLPRPNFNDPFFDDKDWNPYEEMQRMQNDMEQLFNDSFSRFHHSQPFGSLNKTPEVDLKDNADAYVVTVNVPGADKSSLDVKLEGQQLQILIKTQNEQETNGKEYQYQRKERFVGTFHRVLTLPGKANAAKITTDYKNGVLTITVPKQ
jgi:HSP20 family protein